MGTTFCASHMAFMKWFVKRLKLSALYDLPRVRGRRIFPYHLRTGDRSLFRPRSLTPGRVTPAVLRRLRMPTRDELSLRKLTRGRLGRLPTRRWQIFRAAAAQRPTLPELVKKEINNGPGVEGQHLRNNQPRLPVVASTVPRRRQTPDRSQKPYRPQSSQRG